MVKEGTLNGVAADIEKFEQSQNNTPPPTETSTTTVNNNGTLENGTTTTEAPIDRSTYDLPDDTSTQSTEQSQTQTQQPQFDFETELKKLDPKQLAKIIGITDFALELNDHLVNGGKADDYISAKSIDWNKVTDEDLVKEDMRRQFPNLSNSEINRLFYKKYGYTEDADDMEKQDKTLELKADAYTKRQSRIAEQQRFKTPEPIQVKNEELDKWKSDVDNYRQEIGKERDFITNHTATNNLHQNKRVAINVGTDIAPFNIELTKPEIITRVLTDDGTAWNKLLRTETGEPDVPKQQLITLFAFNPQKFISDIFNYGMAMGTRKLVGEGQNIKHQSGPNLTPDQSGQNQGFRILNQGKLSDKTRQ